MITTLVAKRAKAFLSFAVLVFTLSVFANSELYTERPDILKVEARTHSDLPKAWESQKQGHLEAIAELFGMYPDPKQQIYFLARDAELLYDYAKLMTEVPEFSKFKDRIHLLNISRANMNAPHVKEYLAQEGISEESLKSGIKPLFIDTGFSGTIPATIAEKFPVDLRSNLSTHLMSSSNSSHPSTRTFLLSLNPAAHEVNPGSLHGSIIDYEYMPRFTYRSTRFEQNDGRWVPAGDIGKDSDGSVSRETAQKYMSDLKKFARDHQSDLTQRVHDWDHLFSLAREVSDAAEDERKVKRAQLIEHLKSSIASNQPFKTAQARDYLETLRLHYPEVFHRISIQDADIGLKPVSTHFVGSNKLELITKYPKWKKILQDPETEIKNLVDTQDLQTLGSILDVVNDDEITRIAITNLSRDFTKDPPYQAKIRSLIQVLIEKGNKDVLTSLAVFTFSQPHSKDWTNELKQVIEKGDQSVLKDLASQAAGWMKCTRKFPNTSRNLSA